MRDLTKSASLFILITVISFNALFGQENSAERDSTFEAYHSNVWDEVEKAQFSDSLQNGYAKEFFEYYNTHKGTESSEKAFSSAFLMWGNTGNYTHVDEALSTLEDDSKLWSYVIHPLSNIYHRNKNLVYDDYIAYLREHEDRITDPKSKSQLLMSLLRHYKSQDKNDNVRDYAQKIVELDASDSFVDFALGELYEMESLQIGQKAPSFVTETVDGNSVSLSDLNGEFVLLEFWGTWCGPCRPEIPHLKDLKDKHGDEKLTIVGIALDENEKDVQDFTSENKMNWQQILQTEMWDSEIVRSYNVFGVPRMYLVDPEGTIIAKDLRGEEMVSEVDRMITEYFDR